MKAWPVLLAIALTACNRGNPAPPAATGTATEIAPGAPSAAGMQTFVIVPEESRASYVADEELFALAFTKFGLPAGWAKVTGTTQAVAGRFQIDPARPTGSLGDNEFTVRMNTFSTEREMRDNWIRENGPRFNEYPEAKFKAAAIENPGAYRPGEAFSFDLRGDLTIRDITKPATFAVRATLGGTTLKGTATTRVKMSDFGIETITFYNTLTVADEIGLDVQFTARSQQSPVTSRQPLESADPSRQARVIRRAPD